MDLGLEGKTAMVVGAGADVGRATALGLAKEGARVILVGRRREPLDETAAQIQAANGWAQVIPADLGDSQGAKQLVSEALTKSERIDLLANTAGPFPVRALSPNGPEPMYGSDESWSEAFAGVFMTATRLSREIVPLMKAQRAGAVVHLGASSVFQYNPMTAQFGAMKAALVHAIKNWARDAGASGVRVNAVLPGFIKGERMAQRLHASAAEAGVAVEEIERKMVAGHDNLYWMPRMGTPQNYADAIIFLLSERANYINGALIPVNGGTAH